MLRLYSFAITLLTPLVLLHLVWRGLRNRAYLDRWPERFAHYRQPVRPGGVVVHAVSVGEVNAAAPLIRALAQRRPERPVTVTSFTPTGSQRVVALFGDRVHHVYLPLDLPGAVRRFFDHVQPSLLVIMETEIWPNLVFEARRRRVPVMIANARISDTSVAGYRRLRRLIGAALEQVSFIAAQSEEDARRWLDLGAVAERLEVLGNLKFDLNLPAGTTAQGRALRASWGAGRPVVLAGSTHEGDEGPVLEAFLGVLNRHPQALLVLAPRHPERFERAAQQARARGLQTHQHQSGEPCPPATQCYIVDAMGELLNFYAACDVAFVGGSFDRTGGHNVLEPAALGKAVLVGPHTFNFEQITRQLIDCGGALRVADATALERQAARLLADPAARGAMGRAGLQLVQAKQGALERTLAVAEQLACRPGG